MRPNGVRAEGSAARFLTFSGVDDLEVIDVAVWLVEVAVPIEVVTVPFIESLQISSDLLNVHAGRKMISGPAVYVVSDQCPGRSVAER